MDIIPLFKWIRENGEAKAIQRVLMKSIIHLKRYSFELTPESLLNSSELLVPNELYQVLESEAEKVVGLKYKGF